MQDTTIPLVIDLDGTLIKTDSIDETFLEAIRLSPMALLALPMKLIVGRAAVKALFAKHGALDVESWPVNNEFLEYVKAQVEAGRKVALATAADISVAKAIAKRFSFISEVIASDGTHNLKGRAKADELRKRFPDGFIYAGDSSADLLVWRSSSASVVVNATDRVLRQVKKIGEPLAVFSGQKASFSAARRSLRLHQWIKNALVFVPMILGGKIADLAAWHDVVVGFFALGLVASATYIVNDLWDLPSDRRHWSKRDRPLASGDLSVRHGLVLAAASMLLGLLLAMTIGGAAVAMLAIYVLVTLSYSFHLKRVPLLDVFMLASLFTLRIGFGIVVSDVRLSPWLLVFSMFVFLSLSLAKRHTEILRMVERGLQSMHGRGYHPTDAPLMLALGTASTLSAVLIMILYLVEDAFPQGVYANPQLLWFIPPILFTFLGRVWLLCQRGELHDDPVAFAVKDRWSLALGCLMAVSFVSARLLSFQ